MAIKRKKPQKAGKREFFPHVLNMELTYPGGRIQIVKDRQGKHRVVAPEDVKLVVTYRAKGRK